MSHRNTSSNDRFSGSTAITRRDFIGTTLIGAGASLLYAPCPAASQELGQSWTGFGGVGDYRLSNGNTADVVHSAHCIRDGAYAGDLNSVIDTGESVDVVIVGAGFAGMAALYEFMRVRPRGTCLMIDNHPIFGGEAKQNEFDVDGYRLVGPQGSNEFSIPTPNNSFFGPLPYKLWHELGLPDHFEFAKVKGEASSIVFAKENFAAMYSDNAATVGYFFQNDMTDGKGVWVKDIWNDDLKRTPLPERLKKDLITWRDYKNPYQRSNKRGTQEKWGPWLDSMTCAEFVTKVIGLPSDVLRFADPGLAAGVFAATLDGISAYATVGPGLGIHGASFGWMGFPGGNTALLRHFVKAVFPEAIIGPKRFDAIVNNPVDFTMLDRANSNIRMRLKATAIRVAHEGHPATADHVNVVYEKGGQLYRVKAKGVVLAIGSWVAKHIVRDLSTDYRDALARIPHGPILSVNVALHNWRFLDKLGISAARWFDGFGFFANIRQPMLVGDRRVPFHPDKPTILTFYVPFLRPGLPIEAQGPAGRQELYGTSYADFERQIVGQMQRLFGGAGFDARRDIAGIVINRWGHALLSPPPGFFFGKDGKPSPPKVLRERFGRITFGHSELSGNQSWESAACEGTRAITQILELI